MSGVWDSMLAAEEAAIDMRLHRDNYVHAHVSVGRGVMQSRAYDQGITDLLQVQLLWGELTERLAIEELRKAEKSIFWPQFRDDPVIKGDCPRDGFVVVDKEGFCRDCGYEF